MVQLEELGAALDVIKIGMREGDNIEGIAIRRLQLFLQFFFQVYFGRVIVLRVSAMAEVEQDAPPVGQDDLGGIAIPDRVELD